MDELEPGFYLTRGADGNVRLIFAEPKVIFDGVNLVDEYGGIYSIGDVLTEDYNKGPLSSDLVEALIGLDRQRVKFVDDGLAKLAELSETQ